MIGILLLLFTGMYLVLFILLEIKGTDAIRVQQIQFGVEFGQEIQDMVEGRYWIKTKEGETDVGAAEARARDVSPGVVNTRHEVSISSSSTVTGSRWTAAEPEDQLKSNEWVTAVAISGDGNTGVVLGDEGSFFVMTEGEWTPRNHNMDEWAMVGAVSKSGNTHIVAGRSGLVLITTDGGKNWTSPEGLSRLTDERVTAAAVSSDGTTVILGAEDGSAFITTDGGENWEQPDFKLGNLEEVTAVAVSQDGRVRMVAGEDGSAFITTDSGENWTQSDFQLKEGEWLDAVAVSNDGRTRLIAGRRQLASMSTDGGHPPMEFLLKHREDVSAVVVSNNGKIGIVAGDRGSVFVTTEPFAKLWSHGELLRIRG